MKMKMTTMTYSIDNVKHAIICPIRNGPCVNSDCAFWVSIHEDVRHGRCGVTVLMQMYMSKLFSGVDFNV